MSRFLNIRSLEEAKEIEPIDWSSVTSPYGYKSSTQYYHLGTLCINRYTENTETYKILKYLFEEVLPPLKIFKWGEVIQDRKDKKLNSFNGLKGHIQSYLSLLPHGWTVGPKGGFAVGVQGMNFNHIDDNTIKLYEFLNMEESDDVPVNSSYYHSAKAHWLTHSVQQEGLWAPIQGMTHKLEDSERYSLVIHPGSVRSCLIEEMQDPDMLCHIFDPYDVLPVESSNVDEFLELWKDCINKKGIEQDDIAFTMIGGVLEIQTDLANVNFRQHVYEFNKKVTKLSKRKPLNIYIGYDSTHNGVEKLAKYSIEKSIEKSFMGSPKDRWSNFMPEIKMLDISKIPEYNRPYANQSTEFTYSRFLIPYLENYEGFSMFIDDDFFFTSSILPMFYYLHPDDAVACIQYPQYKHDDTKFNGEVNIDYPCKLWSSLMIFNNGHEDCKKLTPEVVNTWTGAQLHQFTWTDKISKIPEKYIFTEGYDDPETKWSASGYHYTRGGPWIKDMDFSKINRLNVYEKVKSDFFISEENK